MASEMPFMRTPHDTMRLGMPGQKADVSHLVGQSRSEETRHVFSCAQTGRSHVKLMRRKGTDARQLCLGGGGGDGGAGAHPAGSPVLTAAGVSA